MINTAVVTWAPLCLPAFVLMLSLLTIAKALGVTGTISRAAEVAPALREDTDIEVRIRAARPPQGWSGAR
ncbi:hypothetical protein [Streptomyces sp. NBC_00286]|uniref:hypothetical protein n=1 Tax=Streptomyces sp. NBC_00286 TaxID=2975701 RepID=UPI002E2C9162|nr:hypothetical protein [Streptomyces sp. NBC_00286]